jgi:SH3-like domain-containing protein
MAFQRGVVTQAYQRVYESPITLKANESVRITKRDLWNDDERYVWIWCINADGKEGWVPESFIKRDGDEGTAIQEYNAIELSVEEGETVTIREEVNGWYWVTDSDGNAGWVPITHITPL